jgi:hypothetical protein
LLPVAWSEILAPVQQHDFVVFVKIYTIHTSITVPGLVNIQKAIENGPVEIVDLPYLPIKHGGSFHSKLRYFLL